MPATTPASGLFDGLHLNGQWHVVHEGGQQFDSGPVSDSQAFALGPEWTHHAGRFDVVLDSYAVATRNVPDRERPALTEAGVGVFARGAVGLTRRFSPAPGVDLFAAVRVHRTESHYEYSYRIVGRVRLRHKL